MINFIEEMKTIAKTNTSFRNVVCEFDEFKGLTPPSLFIFVRDMTPEKIFETNIIFRINLSVDLQLPKFRILQNYGDLISEVVKLFNKKTFNNVTGFLNLVNIEKINYDESVNIYRFNYSILNSIPSISC
jgi:hypothetical protein